MLLPYPAPLTLSNSSMTMPNLNLDDNQSAFQIRSYQPGRIQINEQIFTASVIVTPVALINHWAPQSVDAITAQSLAMLIEMKPDIVLIGTGQTHCFLAANVYGNLINAGIGVEMMETAAAARTFNALTAENRHVVAALIL